MSVTVAKRECDRCPAVVTDDITSGALPDGWLQIMIYSTRDEVFPKSKTHSADLCTLCAADFKRWAVDTKSVTL